MRWLLEGRRGGGLAHWLAGCLPCLTFFADQGRLESRKYGTLTGLPAAPWQAWVRKCGTCLPVVLFVSS